MDKSVRDNKRRTKLKDSNNNYEKESEYEKVSKTNEKNVIYEHKKLTVE